MAGANDMIGFVWAGERSRQVETTANTVDSRSNREPVCVAHLRNERRPCLGVGRLMIRDGCHEAGIDAVAPPPGILYHSLTMYSQYSYEHINHLRHRIASVLASFLRVLCCRVTMEWKGKMV